MATRAALALPCAIPCYAASLPLRPTVSYAASYGDRTTMRHPLELPDATSITTGAAPFPAAGISRAVTDEKNVLLPRVVHMLLDMPGAKLVQRTISGRTALLYNNMLIVNTHDLFYLKGCAPDLTLMADGFSVSPAVVYALLELQVGAVAWWWRYQCRELKGEVPRIMCASRMHALQPRCPGSALMRSHPGVQMSLCPMTWCHAHRVQVGPIDSAHKGKLESYLMALLRANSGRRFARGAVFNGADAVLCEARRQPEGGLLLYESHELSMESGAVQQSLDAGWRAATADGGIQLHDLVFLCCPDFRRFRRATCVGTALDVPAPRR